MFLAKYNANGNDFVLFHTFVARDYSALASTLCDRQNGIGADGLIVLVPHDTYDFQWLFYNSDGSVANMCGNGSRACAHYAFSQGLANAQMTFLTLAGPIRAVVEGTIVQSDLTPPKLIDQTIEAFGKKWWLIDTGVPHLVTFDADIREFDIDQARELRHTYNANVNIAALDGQTVRVRTYERGVENETLACGTGMAACYYRALLEHNVTQNPTTVIPTGGEHLTLAHNGTTITFKGAVSHTFSTQWNMPEW
ncbi:MAG: diaminopimelate epimerase [Sulfuricurvum sp. PC08-66]|nr:MAG: diaminopimelate epimerase [Sulfuricurvum sp. PC08-66]